MLTACEVGALICATPELEIPGFLLYLVLLLEIKRSPVALQGQSAFQVWWVSELYCTTPRKRRR